MKKRFITFSLILCILMSFVMSGCGSKDNQLGGEITASTKPGFVNLYYLARDDYSLVPVQYELKENSKDAQAVEIVNALGCPSGISGTDAPLAGGIKVKEIYMQGYCVVLNFEENYKYIEPSREIFVRAALVESLTQIAGINSVLILIDSQDFVDSSGNIVGELDKDSFVTDTNLYYSNVNDVLKN